MLLSLYDVMKLAQLVKVSKILHTYLLEARVLVKNHNSILKFDDY